MIDLGLPGRILKIDVISRAVLENWHSVTTRSMNGAVERGPMPARMPMDG
jgi:hypothetical protein